MTDCTKDCTVDCGRCKGDPIGTLKRHVMRQLGFSRHAHGGIPFDKKDAWDDGYREAKRAVMRVLYPRPAVEHLTFRTNDGARCFSHCPACAASQEQPQATYAPVADANAPSEIPGNDG